MKEDCSTSNLGVVDNYLSEDSELAFAAESAGLVAELSRAVKSRVCGTVNQLIGSSLENCGAEDKPSRVGVSGTIIDHLEDISNCLKGIEDSIARL